MRGGPRRPTSLLWTDGHYTMVGEAQSSERDRSDGGDLVKARGSKDRRVEWRVHVPLSGGIGQVAPHGMHRVGEVLGYEEDVQSEGISLAPDLVLDRDPLKVAYGSQLGVKVVETTGDISLGLVESMSRWGDKIGLVLRPGMVTGGLDTVAEFVGLQMGLDQSAGKDLNVNGLGDPILLCEVDNELMDTHTSTGPGVGRDLGLTSGGGQTNVGFDPILGGGIGISGISAHVDFGDITVQPEIIPSSSFTWKFSEGVWALFLETVGLGVDVANVPSDQEQENSRSVGKGVSQSAIKLTSEGEEDSDDSVTEFERNLRELLPGLQVSSSRRSEIQKNLSSRFNA